MRIDSPKPVVSSSRFRGESDWATNALLWPDPLLGPLAEPEASPNRPRQFLTTGKLPMTSVPSVRATVSGSRTVVSSASPATATPTAMSVDNRNATSKLSRTSGKMGLCGGRAGSATRMLEFWKPALMPASLILRTNSS